MFIRYFFWVLHFPYIVEICWWWLWEECFSECTHFFLIRRRVCVKCGYECGCGDVGDVLFNLIDGFSVRFVHEFSPLICSGLFDFMVMFFFFPFPCCFIYIGFRSSIDVSQSICFMSQDSYIFIPPSFTVWRWSFVRSGLFHRFHNCLDQFCHIFVDACTCDCFESWKLWEILF